jgi:PilZ domain.
MFIEKRKQLRVDTHIPAEIVIKDSREKLHGYLADLRGECRSFGFTDEEPKTIWGYVENVSEGGIGVSSLDMLLPGTQVIATIGPIVKDIISPTAVLIFAKIDGHLYYYGFKFMVLTQDELQILKRLIRSRTMIEV